MKLDRLTSNRFEDVVTALCDAFHDYAVMRYVIGEAGGEYDARLRELVGYFTQRRFARAHPVLGIEAPDGRLVAAANIDPPQERPASASLALAFAKLRESLGSAAIARYRAFVDACSPFEPDATHYHLGMLGVVPGARGQGYARQLLEAVHALSRAEAESAGVTLTTETPRNLRSTRTSAIVSSAAARRATADS